MVYDFMTTSLQTLLFPVFSLLTFLANGQSTEPFSISFNTYNHAELLSGGTSFILNNDSLVIKKGGIKTGRIVFSKEIDKKIIDEIRSLGLNSLEEYYFNNCVMITSGNEYRISFTDGKTFKRICLHHYYLKQIEQLVVIINNQIPEKYKINYQTGKTKQDCEL